MSFFDKMTGLRTRRILTFFVLVLWPLDSSAWGADRGAGSDFAVMSALGSDVRSSDGSALDFGAGSGAGPFAGSDVGAGIGSGIEPNIHSDAESGVDRGFHSDVRSNAGSDVGSVDSDVDPRSQGVHDIEFAAAKPSSAGHNPPVLELEALIEQALASHPSLSVLESRQKAALALSKAASRFPDPEIGVAYSGAPLSLSFVEDEMTMAELMLSQTFPWFGKREARKRGPQLLALAEESELERQKLLLAAELTEAFSQLWMAVESRRILEEQKNSLENAVLLARGRYAAMGASKSDPLRAELELSALQERFAEIDEKEALARVRLAGLLSLSQIPEAEVGELPEPALPSLPHPSLDSAVVDEVLNAHPEMEKLRVLQGEREHAARLARKEASPDIRVGIAYGHRRIAGDLLTLEVGMPIPIFGKKSAEHESRSALAEADGFKAASAQRLNELRSQFRTAYARAMSRQRMLELYRSELLPQAQRSVETASAAYRSGSGDFAALLQAELLLLEQQLAVVRSKAALIGAVAQLEVALGERRFTGKASKGEDVQE